jgi:hypothetical protein
MNTFSLAQLQYAYPDLINQEYAAMEDYAARVVDEYTEVDPGLREKIKKASPGELIARFFPFALPESVDTIIRYLVFTFVIEDTYSRLPFDTLKVKCERVAAVLRDGIVRPDDEMVIMQLKRCMDEAGLLGATPSWMERFARHNNDFIQSILTETTFYDNSKPIRYPNIPECIRHREDQVAVYPFIDYTELTMGFVLPEAISGHPYIQRLWKLIAYFIIYVNDLYSIDKDIYNEEIMNITLVIQHQEQCTLEEAQIRSLEMHNEAQAEFESLCAAVLNLYPDNKPIEAYIHRLELFVQGNLSWHKMSRRYFEYK